MQHLCVVLKRLLAALSLAPLVVHVKAVLEAHVEVACTRPSTCFVLSSGARTVLHIHHVYACMCRKSSNGL